MEIATFPTQGDISHTGGTGGGQGASSSGYFDWMSALTKLASIAGTQQQKQQQLLMAQLSQLAQPVQGQQVPVFNLSAQLPQKKQEGDSTGQIVNLLAKYYGLGG